MDIFPSHHISTMSLLSHQQGRNLEGARAGPLIHVWRVRFIHRSNCRPKPRSCFSRSPACGAAADGEMHRTEGPAAPPVDPIGQAAGAGASSPCSSMATATLSATVSVIPLTTVTAATAALPTAAMHPASGAAGRFGRARAAPRTDREGLFAVAPRMCPCFLPF